MANCRLLHQLPRDSSKRLDAWSRLLGPGSSARRDHRQYGLERCGQPLGDLNPKIRNKLAVHRVGGRRLTKPLVVSMTTRSCCRNGMPTVPDTSVQVRAKCLRVCHSAELPVHRIAGFSYKCFQFPRSPVVNEHNFREADFWVL